MTYYRVIIVGLFNICPSVVHFIITNRDLTEVFLHLLLENALTHNYIFGSTLHSDIKSYKKKHIHSRMFNVFD